MNVYDITAKSLQAELQVDSVPDIFVIVAKHQVMGLSQEQIAETLSCEVVDIQECEADDLYKRVKAFVGQASAEQTAAQSSGWDALETMALDKLMKRVPYEKDSEFLLRVAAVANRATRKAVQEKSGILDPSLRPGRTTIVLTQRLVAKMNARGHQETDEVRQLSITDGSMANPSFDEIDNLLTVRNIPVRTDTVANQPRQQDVDPAELFETFMRRG